MGCISSREYAEWQAFYNIEPFGSMVEDIRAANIACTVANFLRDPKSRQYRIEEFMVAREQKEEMTEEQMKTVLKAISSSG